MNGLDNLLVVSLAATLVGGALVVLAPPTMRKPMFVAAVAIECLLALAIAVQVLIDDAQLRIALWPMPSVGQLSLVMDPLAALFVVVTSLVFLIGCAFGAERTPQHTDRRRSAAFMALYQFLFGAIVLTLVAGDVLSFVIGWEVMALLLYGLITFAQEDGQNIRPGYLMLAMGEGGMIAGTVGLLLLAAPAADLAFETLHGAAHGLGSGLTWAIFLLTFFGFGVKAGIIPVNQWLADAYAMAPRGFRPVLAGATTNLGIYAIVRIDVDLLAPATIGPGLVALAVGSLTALIGILYATIQPDMRRMLAHSSIENMGIVVASLGAGLVFAAEAHPVIAAMAFVTALYHMVNHAFYKALLFTGAGSIEDRAGTSDMDRLGGLVRRMPVTAFLFLIGTLAIASLPPLNGFVSEWLTLETMLRAAVLSSTAAKIVFALSGALLALTAGLAVTCFVKAFAMSFLGVSRSKTLAAVREPPFSARGPMAAFAALCILLGVLPTLAIPVFDRTVGPLAHASAVEALVPPFFATEQATGAPLPAAFRAEFHDLGAEVGKNILPARGLVVLHRGGEKNPVVFAMSTSYTAVVLAILLLLVFGLFKFLTRRRAVVDRPAWDGGLRQLRAGHTYTASGFSNPVRVVFHALLRPQTVEDSTEAVGEHFRTAVRRVVAEPHPTDRLFLDPLASVVRGLANILRRMHQGRVNAYTAYVLVVLLVSLVLGLWRT